VGRDFPLQELLVPLPAEPSGPAVLDPAALRTESLELVLESLADLFADPLFLSTLFASFDCDPARKDLVQPLMQVLSRCTR
jgi:hypothetical protein